MLDEANLRDWEHELRIASSLSRSSMLEKLKWYEILRGSELFM